ncbi:MULTISPECIES: hypothetical protein [Bacillota]|uniref:hypothetical protein n=1 Tax=Bacillota TaxID=1239 RepID=UPI0039EE07C6
MKNINLVLSVKKDDLTYEVVEVPFPNQTEYQIFTIWNETPHKQTYNGYFLDKDEALKEVFRQTGIARNTDMIGA